MLLIKDMKSFRKKLEADMLPEVRYDAFQKANIFFTEKYDFDSFNEEEHKVMAEFFGYGIKMVNNEGSVWELMPLADKAAAVFRKYTARGPNKGFPDCWYIQIFINNLDSCCDELYNYFEDMKKDYEACEVDIVDFKGIASGAFAQKKKSFALDVETRKNKSKREDRLPKNRKLGKSNKRFAEITVC